VAAAETWSATSGGGRGCCWRMGLLAALVRTGRPPGPRPGWLDASMVDGRRLLDQRSCTACTRPGLWGNGRGANTLDGGRAVFYDTYRASDGRYVAVRRDRAALLGGTCCRCWTWTVSPWPDRANPDNWARRVARRSLASRIATRNQGDEWAKLARGAPTACPDCPYSARGRPRPTRTTRGTRHVRVGRRLSSSPRPAPKFTRTPPARPTPPSPTGGDNRPRCWPSWALTTDEISALRVDRGDLLTESADLVG